MSLYWLKVCLLLWTVSVCSGASNMEAHFNSVDTIDGEEETLAVFRLRLVGRERLLNGIFLADFDENYVGAIDIYMFKNGEWVQANIRPRTTPCDLFSSYVKKYFFLSSVDTNFPSPGEKCIKQKVYYIKNAELATENWPPNIPRGLGKLAINVLHKGKTVGGLEVVYNMFDKPT